MDSILTSIKKMLGIEEDYEQFDPDIIMSINSVFTILDQLGVGPKGGLVIQDKTTEWDAFMTSSVNLEAVKSYVFLRVRLMFDPPQMGYFVEAIKDQCRELEWRLNVQAESEGGPYDGLR